MSQRVRHAQKSRVNANKLDRLGMLNRLARLKGSALRRAALGRAIVVLALATTMSVAAASEINNGSYRDWETDRKSTRLNSSHLKLSRMPSSA